MVKVFISVLLIGIVVSCSTSTNDNLIQNETIEKSLEDAAIESKETNFTHELGTVRKNIEQAANLYKRLYNKECPFNESLIEDKFEKFNTTKEKALALGRYSALFVYTASYEQTQSADDYLTELLLISEGLGIREVFNEEQLKLLYDPNPDIDKSAILTKAYLKATEQMYSEEKALLVSYMVAGGWVQGMKLSYEICGNYLDDQSVTLSLYDQTYSYYNCIRLLEETNGNLEEPTVLLEQLAEIESQIESVVKSRGQISIELYEEISNSINKLDQEIN